MRISLIVAMTDNRVIGADDGMPWHISSDLKQFKERTMGKPIIMGGKTHRSIGRLLPGRDNIVITRSPENLADGAMPARNLDDALVQAHECARQRDGQEIMVIGGGEIYAQALDMADRIYLTLVHERVNGDTYFPKIDPGQWQEIEREHNEAGPKDSADFTTIVLDKS
jgi:dihydrofolate reductase